jgi:hypothetical protein
MIINFRNLMDVVRTAHGRYNKYNFRNLITNINLEIFYDYKF